MDGLHFQEDFCILNYDDKYIYIYIISEPMTWNLYELVAFQIIFVFVFKYDDTYT